MENKKRMPLLIQSIKQNMPRLVGVEEAMWSLCSGNNIFVQGMAATPTFLTEAMTRWGISQKLTNLSVHHMHTEGECPYIRKDAQPYFRSKSFFVGQNVRHALADGVADYIPVFMGSVPRLFRKRIIPLDVALVQMSPPDNHGVCSLGPSVEVSLAAIETAKHVVCQINHYMPRTQGDALVHIQNVDTIVEHDAPLYTSTPKDPTPEDKTIGKLIASHLVPDGATLQLGIGNIPNMVLAELQSHKDLGIHSEMLSDGVVNLVRNGVITNAKKKVDPGRMVVSFMTGSSDLFAFAHNNSFVEMRDAAYTNDPYVIAKQDHMITINSAIEVDITGQICSDSIGKRVYSGFGGQLDFIYGASMATHGKAIIALHSRTSQGHPRIVPQLHQGAGVVTTRGHADYIVTEYGIASLYGKALRERALGLIEIAHPEDRTLLLQEAKHRKLL